MNNREAKQQIRPAVSWVTQNFAWRPIIASSMLACLCPNLLRTGVSEFVSRAIDEKAQHLVARNVILYVSQFSTPSSRNGHSHPLARNACKEQTNSTLLI